MAQILIFGDVTNVHGFGREAGAVKIASVLRASGYKCQVVDYFSDFTFSELQTVLDLYVTTETLWVGFSTTHFAQAMPAERLLELESKANTRVFEFSRECKYFPFDDQFMEEVFAEIRRRNPNCRIVVGGFKAGYTQDFPGVDYWVVGDGEGAALALTASLVGTNTSLKTSPAKSGQILNGNHDYPCIQEFPNFGMLWDGSDHLQSNEFLPVEIARGCSFRCRFCNYSLTGNGQILRNMDSLRDEFLRNYEMYSIKGYLFVDHMVNDSVAKLRDLCEMISRLPFEIEWSGFLRLDLIHKYPEMRDLLLGSGLRSAQFGIETLNPKALKAIGKGLAPEKLIRTLQFLRETWKDRVVMGTGLIVGLPDDSWESIDETIDFFLDPDAPIDSVIVSPLSIRKYDQKWTSFRVFLNTLSIRENMDLL